MSILHCETELSSYTFESALFPIPLYHALYSACLRHGVLCLVRMVVTRASANITFPEIWAETLPVIYSLKRKLLFVPCTTLHYRCRKPWNTLSLTAGTPSFYRLLLLFPFWTSFSEHWKRPAIDRTWHSFPVRKKDRSWLSIRPHYAYGSRFLLFDSAYGSGTFWLSNEARAIFFFVHDICALEFCSRFSWTRKISPPWSEMVADSA